MNILSTIAANPTFVIAAGTVDFWTTPVGGAVRGLLVAAGILVVIVGLFKATKEVLGGGATAKAMKIVLGTMLLAVFMFKPDLIQTMVGGLSAVIEAFFNTISSFFK